MKFLSYFINRFLCQAIIIVIALILTIIDPFGLRDSVVSAPDAIESPLLFYLVSWSVRLLAYGVLTLFIMVFALLVIGLPIIILLDQYDKFKGVERPSRLRQMTDGFKYDD